MDLKFRRVDLQLRHSWAIAADGPSSGKSVCPVVFVELTDSGGTRGLGEGSPSSQYHESVQTMAAFLEHVDPRHLSFDDLPSSMTYLDSIASGNYPAKCAINLALIDGSARATGRTACGLLGLKFEEGRHETSFSIGLDSPDEVERKVREAGGYPILKLKVGGLHDRENLAAVRCAAPGKTLRVDANGAWKTRELALEKIEWLARDPLIEFVEQPMPADTSGADLEWLHARSPVPLFADESYQSARDASRCAAGFHGVNVKLVKAGGLTGAYAALKAARAAGLKTMIGCMIESSVLITAGAHLAELADYLDLDGNVLITNDPYQGVRNLDGMLSFQDVREPFGLRVQPQTVQKAGGGA
ncbi:MAG: dipeptide epimerase [Pedosphaera sp.]|nr:dipeptide epimerase [Pedosphaera sp.]